MKNIYNDHAQSGISPDKLAFLVQIVQTAQEIIRDTNERSVWIKLEQVSDGPASFRVVVTEDAGRHNARLYREMRYDNRAFTIYHINKIQPEDEGMISFQRVYHKGWESASAQPTRTTTLDGFIDCISADVNAVKDGCLSPKSYLDHVPTLAVVR